MTNSFETLRDSEPLWLEVGLDKVIFRESIVPDLFEHGISQLLICNGRVSSSSGREGDIAKPFEFVRLEVRTAAESDIVSLKAKFPLGWVEIAENSTNIVLFVRQSLLNSMSQHLPVVSSGGIYFSLTLPLVEHYGPGLYPFLAYGYHATSDRSSD